MATAATPATRAKAELEYRRRTQGQDKNPYARYRFDPIGYIQDKLGWHPWAGDPNHPGQVEVLQAYTLALRQLHERAAYEQGELTKDQLRLWRPGQTIRNRIRIEAGHTVGKTKIAAGIVSHFFDTCAPSIIYSFAPSYEQINDLLWKEIRVDRRKNNLPGRVLETPELKYTENHFAKGRATNNAGGRGTERIQGQHGRYLMFVLDEAEGVADFVYDAVESMASGGIAMVLMLANPRTRVSKFYKQRGRDDVANFRISCLWHPNVLADREIVPGAVRRDYVTKMLEEHAEQVEAHDEDAHTFALPWADGVIYRPDAEFMFRVLGIPPANLAVDTLVPMGRYEAAVNREPQPAKGAHTRARLGVDVARWGNDLGTLYVQHDGRVWRAAQFAQQDTMAYFQRIKAECLRLHADGVVDIEVRVDGGGGFGGGVIDLLNHDAELTTMFTRFVVREVHFNATPHDGDAYDDLVTEMYAEAAESLRGIAVIDPPDALEVDLTERKYRWVNRAGVAVKRLEPKDDFRKPTRVGRSPDDGDGCVLALAPDHIFAPAKQAGTWGSGRLRGI